MANLELAAEKPAAKAPVKAANEDTPTGGALFRLIARRPSKRIAGIALFLSFLWLCAVAAYFGSLYGTEGVAVMGPQALAQLAGIALIPVIMIAIGAWSIWRGQQMHLMAEALARTAMRLTDPADTASGEVASIANAVDAELERMKAGLAAALSETSRLRDMISEDLDAIEQGGTRAEMRAARMEELITHHHDSLTELGRMMGQESDVISRGLRGQVEAVRGLIGQAEHTLQSASQRVVAETETLNRVSEAARAGADATASTLDRQASRLEVVADTALSKAGELTNRYETQRQILADAANSLSTESTRLEGLFENHRDQLALAGSVVSARTKEISDAADRVAKHVTTTLDAAADRAAQVRSEISGEVNAAVAEVTEASGAISRTTGAATRAINVTIEEMREAVQALNDDLTRAATESITATTDDLRIATNAMTSEVSRATAALTEDISGRAHELRGLVKQSLEQSDETAERFNAAMIRLGGTAREAGNSLDHAAAELEARMALMPEEAAAGAAALTQVLQDQVTALAAIADIVVRHARVLDRSAPMPPMPVQNNAPQAVAQSPVPTYAQPAPPPPPARATGEGRGWNIPDLLAAAGRGQEPDAKAPPRAPESETEFQRSSLQVIETLQALAIDLDRALEQSPSPDLWQRYQAGDRNVFARRLYNMSGRQLYDRISTKYRAESEFREHVDRFVELFERLLGAASSRDRDNILVETYLTSDTGKVYLMLAQASGKLG
ncbi:MAG: hypothetical protein Q7S99_11245 [Parvibaculum sp.]|nr:hypothetical protein [Parvibaculum sp.]|tara:strand:- start:2706 stop:4910 length:2205 start_codon:yes stop_codon:yes gene_type:complete